MSLIKHNNPPLDDNEVVALVGNAFKRYSEKSSAPAVYDLRQAGEEYAQHVASLKERRVLTGFKKLDEKTRGVFPGEVVALIAKTSNGKTALALNLGRNYARASSQPVLFFSLEMPLPAIYERTYQLEMDKAGYEVEEEFLTDEMQVRKNVNLVFGKLPTLYFIPDGGLTLADIGAAITHCETEVYRRPTGLVIIDYLSLVHSERYERDDYLKTARIARGMKQLAKCSGVPIIFLSQVTKAHGIADELTLDAGRDSGAIAEAADIVLGLWREAEMKSKHRLDMVMAILKNTQGGLGTIPVEMDRRTLAFYERAGGK